MHRLEKGWRWLPASGCKKKEGLPLSLAAYLLCDLVQVTFPSWAMTPHLWMEGMVLYAFAGLCCIYLDRVCGLICFLHSCRTVQGVETRNPCLVSPGPQERLGTRLLITGVTAAKIKEDRVRDGAHMIQSASNTHDNFGSSLAAARPSSQHRRECSRWSQGQENTDWNDKHWEGRQT